MCPLKYTLEALAINEVAAGLQINDTLQGVPVQVSANLILNLVRIFTCRVTSTGSRNAS